MQDKWESDIWNKLKIWRKKERIQKILKSHTNRDKKMKDIKTI